MPVFLLGGVFLLLSTFLPVVIVYRWAWYCFRNPLHISFPGGSLHELIKKILLSYVYFRAAAHCISLEKLLCSCVYWIFSVYLYSAGKFYCKWCPLFSYLSHKEQFHPRSFLCLSHGYLSISEKKCFQITLWRETFYWNV